MEEVSSDPIQVLRLQVEGMRAKLEKSKRFRARYQANLALLEEMAESLDRTRRENRKLRIAISEVALARSETSTVRSLVKYASKVLEGLGYTPRDAEMF
jgi:hypothetical protein